MTEEIWKEIPDFEGYQVGNLGRVKGRKILKGALDKDGYIKVWLYSNGKSFLKFVHRLVATAFIPNLGNLPCINHKDENKSNNLVENLEWCTPAYNNAYNGRHQRIAEALIDNSKKCIPVKQFDMEGNFIAEFPSIRRAAEATNVDAASIKKACVGYYIHYGKKINTNHAGGFKWQLLKP